MKVGMLNKGINF